jgi:hypothetical protein
VSSRPWRVPSGSDLGIVRDVVENHLGELLEFVAAIRRKL